LLTRHLLTEWQVQGDDIVHRDVPSATVVSSHIHRFGHELVRHDQDFGWLDGLDRHVIESSDEAEEEH
jgi:hypothetical protein